jgi:hypothetical protein
MICPFQPLRWSADEKVPGIYRSNEYTEINGDAARQFLGKRPPFYSRPRLHRLRCPCHISILEVAGAHLSVIIKLILAHLPKNKVFFTIGDASDVTPSLPV